MTPTDTHPHHRMRGAVQVLRDILNDLRAHAPENAADQRGNDRGPTATLGDVVDRLDERAFGFLLLLLALPCCLPFVYVLPQIVALPMLALAGQMAMGGRHPWLPKKLHDRRFEIAALARVLSRAERYVGWVERFASPRLRPVTSHLGNRIVGVLLLAPIASILVPLPSTNTAPGIGVAISALGLIERDGVLVVGGLLFGIAWVALLLILGNEAVELIRGWLSARA